MTRRGLRPVWLLLVACAGWAAQRPVLYLGERPTAAAEAKAEADVHACLEVGTQYRSPSGMGGAAARDTAVGGAVGAAGGAAGGAIWGGNAGRGAAAGAAAGAATGLVQRLLRGAPPDPAFRGAVERCLADRGLRVIAWE